MNDQMTLSIDDARLRPVEDLDRPRSLALIVGVLGALATIGGFFYFSPEVFYTSYLIGWLLWIGIPVAMMFICMMTHLSGGRWGIMMHRVHLEAGKTLPFFALAGLPILVGGMTYLFPWARPEAATDALVLEKTGYLKLMFEFEGNNPEWMSMIPGFYPRYVLFFLIWGFWTWRLSSLAKAHDETGDEAYRVKSQRWSAGGMLAFIMVATFVSIDWIMSTDPHWFSSLYGPQLLVWQGLSALCFSIPLLIFLSNRQPLDRIIRRKHFHDYGKLMLALTMVWGYFTVSQFLIIWSGNLPEEITWYIHRNSEGWKAYTVALMVASFVVPFLILLSQDIKFKPKVLLRVAVLILIVRWFDYYFQVAPNLHHDGISLHIFNLAPVTAIGGLWVWLFLGRLKNRVLVPIHEQEIKEALADG